MIFATFDVALQLIKAFSGRAQVHELCTNLIIVLIGIHVGAALYHHFIARDHTTARMVRFWKRTQNYGAS